MTDIYLYRELGSGASLEWLRASLRVPRPISVKDLIARHNEPVVLTERLVTNDGIALSGSHTTTLNRNGSYRYEGYIRATGWPSYRVALSTQIIGSDGIVLVLAAQAKVHGTNEPGGREGHWLQQGNNPLIAMNWASLRHARMAHDLQYNVNFFGTIGDVLTFVAKAAVASAVAGPAGVVVVLSAEAASALEMPGVALPGTVGILVAAGTVLVYGPTVLIPATVAGAAAGAAIAHLIEQRQLKDHEYTFVDSVFKGTLPRERILLTNLLGIGDRAFVIPGPGNTILVNIGRGFENPIDYTGTGKELAGNWAPGELLIHELAHAWQITHSTFLPGTMCSAITTQLSTLGSGMSVYTYGLAGPSWNSFNLEQQASIVAHWFAGSRHSGTLQSEFASKLENTANPYWRYIRDNIRTRIV